MHQVRAPRTHHVAVPPAAPTALELSREEREQLRIVRHHAYQRYQRNASWMRELLIADSTGVGASNYRDGKTEGQVENAPADQPSSEVEALKQRLNDQEQAYLSDHQRHLELVTALRAMDSEASLDACRTRVMEEATRHAQSAKKELKTIKL